MNFDIASLKRKMLVKYPFFGSIVTNVDFQEDEAIPTAGTDGKRIIYNPKFLEEKSVDEQIFVLAHEVCHIAFDHINRSEGKDKNLWNIATDGVINQLLKKYGLKLVDGAVDIDEAINYDAEDMYDILLKEKEKLQQQMQQQGEQQQQQGQQSGITGQVGAGGQGEKGQQNQQNNQQNSQGGDNQNNSQDGQSGGNGENSEEQDKDVGHDSHSMWAEAVKNNKLDKQDENKNNSSNSKQNNEIEKKQEETKQMGEKEAFKQNAQEKKERLEKLKEEIAREAAGAGSHSNGDIRNLGEIGSSKAIVDWKRVLKSAANQERDWSYKHATIENGVVKAHLEKLLDPETEIVLDTSGSISPELLRNFIRECKNIMNDSHLKVGCFDTKFYGFHDIRSEKDIENMKFEGGGGTDFDVAVGAFSKTAENKIIFTDGYARMPKEKVDAIWIVFGDDEIKPPGGKVVFIDPEQLDKLNSRGNTRSSGRRY